jgi:hypothetical protein
LLALTLTTVALLMSEPTSQEPTMEEILASIRRIISEDEVPAEEGAEEAEEAEEEPDTETEPEDEPIEEPEPEPVAAFEPEPAPVFDDEEDILDLTEPYKAPEPAPVFQSEDLEAYAPVPARPDPVPMPVIEEPIVSHVAEVAAASAFGHLAQTIAMPGHGRTLEDVVRELLRPMLKTWLDENLPTIVQATVDEEVSRISRRRL